MPPLRLGTLWVILPLWGQEPGEKELYEILRGEKQDMEVCAVSHSYSFRTHSLTQRRKVHEYIFVARWG